MCVRGFEDQHSFHLGDFLSHITQTYARNTVRTAQECLCERTFAKVRAKHFLTLIPFLIKREALLVAEPFLSFVSKSFIYAYS